MSLIREHNLLNVDGDIINPATEDKQDAVIALLQQIAILLGATEVVNSWAYYSTIGSNPQTWEAMETAGTYERTWTALEA